MGDGVQLREIGKKSERAADKAVARADELKSRLDDAQGHRPAYLVAGLARGEVIILLAAEPG